MVVFHASPHKFAFPDYSKILSNRVNHENGQLGLWFARRPDWINPFGEFLYEFRLLGTGNTLSISQLAAWSRSADTNYTSLREDFLRNGVDYLEVIETDGLSYMGIVLNLEAIREFSPITISKQNA